MDLRKYLIEEDPHIYRAELANLEISILLQLFYEIVVVVLLDPTREIVALHVVLMFLIYTHAAFSNGFSVLITLYRDYRKYFKPLKPQNFDLHYFLENPKALEVFKDYLRKEWNVEWILCYMDIQNFKRATYSDRDELGKSIIEMYLCKSSPLELGIKSSIRAKFQSSEVKDLPKDFFKPIEDEIVVFLADVFNRFKYTTEYSTFVKK